MVGTYTNETQIELKRKIEELEAEISQNVQKSYDKHEILKLTIALNDARSLARDESLVVNEPIRMEIEQLRQELAAAKKGKTVEVPESVNMFIKELNRGVDWGGNWDVKWISSNTQFVYMCVKGRSSWSGRALNPISQHNTISLT